MLAPANCRGFHDVLFNCIVLFDRNLVKMMGFLYLKYANVTDKKF